VRPKGSSTQALRPGRNGLEPAPHCREEDKHVAPRLADVAERTPVTLTLKQGVPVNPEPAAGEFLRMK
jgi:hypothetical protein